MLMGCSSAGKLTEHTESGMNEEEITEIIAYLDSSRAKLPNSLRFKINMSVGFKGKSTALSAAVRMVVDSAIWISVTAYGYEVVRVIALPDTLKYMSRMDKKYFIGSYDFLENILGVELSFNDIQSVMIARNVGLADFNKADKSREVEYYVFNNMRVKDIKRTSKSPSQDPKIDHSQVMYTHWVRAETYQIEKINILDIQSQNQALIEYFDFIDLGNFVMPEVIKMHVRAKDNIAIEGNISKYMVNIPLKFPFKVLSKYEEIVE